MKNGNTTALDYIRVALALLLTIGTLTFMQPCVHEDGNFGTCHWAGQALTGLGVVLTLQSVIGLFSKNNKLRQGVSLAMIPTVLLTGLVPGQIIPLCMMATMRCNTTMKPLAILIAALIGLVSIADVVVRHKRAKQESQP